MHSQPILTALLSLALLACGGEQSKEQAAHTNAGTDAVAVVDGQPISREAFDAYLTDKKLAEPEIELDQQTALNEMINMELIKQEAIAQGIHQREDVQAELENQRTTLLVNTLVSERVDELSFSEDELRKEYEEQIADMAKQEYKARHVLVKTEKEARAIIDRLKQGEDFVALAVEESIGPAGPEGGDLGWFHPDTMVPPFAAAVRQLEPGDYTKEPVKTQFGWHVILLEDTRPMELPAFTEVKDRLEGILVNAALQDYLDELRAEAEIEIKQSPGPE